MANKFYTTEKTINGKTYKAQFNGISAALEAVDNCYIDGTSNVSMVKMAEYVLSNVIVEPKGLTPDDFDTLDEFQEVIGFGREVMEGKFRPAKDDSAAKKASK